MPIKYEMTPPDTVNHVAHPPEDDTLPAPALPVPDVRELPTNADPYETIVLVVERTLGRTPKDERYKRTLAQWLATRHPQHPAAWWLTQWGLS